MLRCYTFCGAALLAILLSFVADAPARVVPPTIPEGSTAGRQPPWFVFRIAVAVNELFELLASSTRPPHARIKWLASSYWQSEVTYSLTVNGIIDTLGATGPAMCAEVAARLELQANFLCRMMSAGGSLKLLAVDAQGRYSLTPTGELLRKDNPSSLHSFLLFTNEETRAAWRAAGTVSLRSGESGFKQHYGIELWDWSSDPANAREVSQFNMAMKSFSSEISGSLMVAWAPPKLDAVVCDIGGGVGHMLASMAEHYPQLRGILFDLPHVVERAAANFEQNANLSSRLTTVAGSFFNALPTELGQCDVFYLKFIVPDWPDDDIVSILKNLVSIAKPGAMLVTTDFVLNVDGTLMETHKRMADINMMAVQPPGAMERTFEQYASLFKQAGLTGQPKLIKMRALVSTIVVDLSL